MGFPQNASVTTPSFPIHAFYIELKQNNFSKSVIDIACSAQCGSLFFAKNKNFLFEAICKTPTKHNIYGHNSINPNACCFPLLIHMIPGGRFPKQLASEIHL